MLKTVKIPKKFEALFKKAEKTVQSFFDKKEFDVSKASITISGERYLLIRASSLSVDFFECVMDLYRDKEKSEAINVIRQLLCNIGHALGMKDAEHFHRTMNLVDPLEKLSVCPAHFAYTGWAFIGVYPESKLVPDDNFLRIYDSMNAFEAEAWMKSGKKTEVPVCIMASGYSSGWNEQSLGIPLVSSEITCRAKGDPSCHFVMAHPSRIENYIKNYLKLNPDIAKRATNYEIPGFFKLKMAEGALKEANAKLTEANKELSNRTIALEEKTRLIETLSEIGELLPTCITNDEVYALFGKYAEKLFPNYQGELYAFKDNKKQFHVVSSWGKNLKKEEAIFSPQDCWAIRRGQTYLVQPPFSGPRCDHVSRAAEGYLCLPLTAGVETFGLISLVFGKSPFSQDDLAIISRLASDVASALFNVSLRNSLRELSIHDYLTGLYNRRYLEEMLTKEVAKADRNGADLGIIMFDIDNFKKFNDTFGHDGGDAVLSNIGKFLKDDFRESDIICRFGGEEFVVTMIGANQETVLTRAESLRQNIKKLHTKFGNQMLDEINISLGVAVFPEHGRTVRSLLDAADKALYSAKNEGRDRVCLAT